MDGKVYRNRGEYVFETLKREILDLVLKPGQAISENEICARFEVSRTPVREALRRLQEQGFVHTIPYSGTCVTRLNLGEIRQMIYMRVAVELMVMRDFMKEATLFQFEEIRHQIRLQELLIRQADFEPEQFYQMDARMHAIWFESTGKERLWEVIQAQQLHYTRFRMLDFVTETDFTRIIHEHSGLLKLMEQQEEKGLEEALKKHLYISMTRMKHAIEVEYKEYFE
ncbi:MAG: GntR family transcriptional regulator [Lachnospiraceae bacterium]|nr:GntR family transcriptional regulator [Lachnospiraceae bacterium]